MDLGYDGNAFNVRDMRFPPPAEKQLARLRKQLGRKIDETRWEQVHGVRIPAIPQSREWPSHDADHHHDGH